MDYGLLQGIVAGPWP
jgi:hypothetical protein